MSPARVITDDELLQLPKDVISADGELDGEDVLPGSAGRSRNSSTEPGLRPSADAYE